METLISPSRVPRFEAGAAEEPRPARALTIVIPAFNEAARIGRSLTTLDAFLKERGYTFEILVVDDGSTDTTVRVVQDLATVIPNLRVLSYGRNRGPGYAVRAGILAAQLDAVLYTDADLSTPIEDIDRLWEWYDRGFDVVIASRQAFGAQLEIRQPLHRRILGRVFRMIVQMLCVRGFRDTQCGFKLFRALPAKQIFKRVKSSRFTFNVEMLIYARGAGLKIREVPVRWSDVAGSRISALRESLRTFVEVLRIRGILPRKPAEP